MELDRQRAQDEGMRLCWSMLLLALLAGCGRPALPSTGIGPGSDTLVVGGASGVRLLDLEGRLVRTLSSTPARKPRFVDGGRSVIFLAREGGELRRLRLSCERGVVCEETLAVLPPDYPTCKKTHDHDLGHRFKVGSLHVDSDDDLVIVGNEACLTLRDRNENMMNVEVQIRVDLATRRLRHQVVSPSCTNKEPPRCEHRGAQREEGRFPYHLVNGHVVRRGGGRVSQVGHGEFFPERDDPVSPSKRWVVLSGDPRQGDYIFRSLLLLDQQTGAVHAIHEKSNRALTAAELGSLDRIHELTTQAAAESAVRWLRESRTDLLLVDSLLVVPGQRAIKLEGDVAR